METSVNVIRKEIIKIDHVDKIKIELSNLILGSCAEFNISFVNEIDEHFKYHRVKIQGADYLNWMNDDNFVIDYILNHLELVKSDL
jgi:hypothetical protein